MYSWQQHSPRHSSPFNDYDQVPTSNMIEYDLNKFQPFEQPYLYEFEQPDLYGFEQPDLYGYQQPDCQQLDLYGYQQPDYQQSDYQQPDYQQLDYQQTYNSSLSELLQKDFCYKIPNFCMKIVDDLTQKHNYKFVKFINSGSFGVANLFEDKYGIPIVVKSMFPSTFSSVDYEKIKNIYGYIDNNLFKCKKDSGKFVLTYDIIENIDNIYHVHSESMDGDLEKFKSKNYGVEIIDKVAKQLIDGLNCIHKINIIHGDIKPQNILYRKYPKFIVKFIDFDSSGVNGQPVDAFTKDFVPFTFYEYKSELNEISDRFALGLTILYLYDEDIAEYFLKQNGIFIDDVSTKKSIKITKWDKLVNKLKKVKTEKKINNEMMNEITKMLKLH